MILNIHLQGLDKNSIFGIIRSDVVSGYVRNIASVPIKTHIYIVNTKWRESNQVLLAHFEAIALGDCQCRNPVNHID